MSIQALYTAATGMDSLQSKLDVISNNLANANTTAFKQDRANFEDLLYRHEILPGQQDSNGQLTPTGIEYGYGSRVQSTQTDYTQGSMQQTNGQLDVAIQGIGFFQVLDPSSNSTVYTRAGNFSLNSQGKIVVGSATVGRLLQPEITIPPDAQQISISPQGIVSYKQPSSNQLTQAGTVQLATFINPQGLIKLGDNMYGSTESSGTATVNTPGQVGMGTLQQSFLEGSNVQPVQQLIDLITTQRSFELNSQAVQAGDQIMQLVNNLRHS